MKRLVLYFTLIISAITIPTDGYARNIRDFFNSEPGIFLSILPEDTRLDMLDYYDSGRIISTKNGFEGDSQLKKVTDNFISLALTESVDIEMMMIPISKKDTIIVANSIFKIPMLDSWLQFFTPDWDEINANKFIKEPTIADFISSKDKKIISNILDVIDFPIISYSINPENGAITANLNIDQYMSKDEYRKISKYLNSTITYNLIGKKYKMVK